MAFDKYDIVVNAGQEVTVIFENKDVSVPHNLAIYKNKAATQAIFVGETITGPATITYKFTAPTTPGSYYFRCDTHPNMNGALIVQGTTT